MRVNLIAFATIALGASSAFAQDHSWVPTFGVKIGVPITDMFDARNTTNFGLGIPGSNYSSAMPRYEVGVSGEFHLPYHLRFEVDGLYKRSGYTLVNGAVIGTPNYASTSMNVWEVPGVFKYNIALGHFRPFIDFGASLRHISTIRDESFSNDFSTLTFSKNAPELYNRNSYGGVAGFGITFKKGPFELTPEVRYTRWANQSFRADGLLTNLDQGDVLLGISF